MGEVPPPVWDAPFSVAAPLTRTIARRRVRERTADWVASGVPGRGDHRLPESERAVLLRHERGRTLAISRCSAVTERHRSGLRASGSRAIRPKGRLAVALVGRGARGGQGARRR